MNYSGDGGRGSSGTKFSGHLFFRGPLIGFACLALWGCQADDDFMRGNFVDPDTQVVNRAAKRDRLYVGALAKIEPVQVHGSGLRMEGAMQPSSSFSRVAPEYATGAFNTASPGAEIAARVPLAGFYRALEGLEAGTRTRPLNIVHLGDSHIAGDNITGRLRTRFQARFGDAGRGLVAPPGGYRYYKARGLRFEQRGVWRGANVLRSGTSAFGLSGIRSISGERGSVLEVSSPDAIDAVELLFETGPQRGVARIEMGDVRKLIDCRAEKAGFKRVRVEAPARIIHVFQHDAHPIALYSLAFLKTMPGVRYVNLGIPGATIASTERKDGRIWRDELRHLSPELVILGFGTNEAFNDRLKVERYRRRVEGLIVRIKKAAPKADILIMGPPDVARVPGFMRRSSRRSDEIACRPLSVSERGSYFDLLGKKDEALGRWFAPISYKAVQGTLRNVARDFGLYFWDWSKLMGGACGVHVWAHSKPRLAARDHVHLTGRGYRRTADALFDDILSGYKTHKMFSLSAR